jgi:maltose O-acetyltransferase
MAVQRRYHCLFGAYIAGGSVEFGKEVCLNVKVRSDGRGRVLVGADTSFGYSDAMRLGNGEVLLQARTGDSLLTVGPQCRFSNNVAIVACQKVTLGSGCLLGDGVTIYDTDFHSVSPEQRHTGTGVCEPVVIGNNVWLGSRSMVLKGVTIGDNTVIAPMSVVTTNIDANVIAAGVPARKVRDIE